MENPTTLIGIISLLFTGVIGLIVYLWKQKDKQSEATNTKLDQILEAISSTGIVIAEIKKDVTNHYSEISTLREKTDEHSSELSDLKSDVSMLMEFKRNIDSK